MSVRAIALAAIFLAACGERMRQPVSELPELGYPTCDGAPLPPGDVVAQGYLRSGPTMREHGILERFEIRRRGCAYVGTLRQEWPLSVADVDLVWDLHWAPLRAWKRLGMPGPHGTIDHIEIERYELRTDPIGLLRRTATGEIERFLVRGGSPRALITPGRGLLTGWLRGAHLAPGHRVRERVLDIREPIAQVADVTLERLEDADVEGLGRVRVYTIFGREPIYADEHDTVIADLFGLRPDATLDTPAPEPIRSPTPPDPLGHP